MTHSVNAAAYRIGKNLDWHSLGSPMFRFKDMKTGLFLNCFLSSFLEKQSYRLVRYGLRFESRALKIAVVAFRAMDTSRSRQPENRWTLYETYWKRGCVYKSRFKHGVFYHKFYGVSAPMNPLPEDVIGTAHLNKLRRFLTEERWGGKPVPLFFLDGVSAEADEESRSVTFPAAMSLNSAYFVKIASRLMVLRYALKKSVMSVIGKRILPAAPAVFNQAHRGLLQHSAGNLIQVFSSFARAGYSKNLLLFFIRFRSGRSLFNATPRHARFSRRFRAAVLAWARGAKKKLTSAGSLQKKLKKKYFLFKKKSDFWNSRAKRILRSRKRFLRSGNYSLKKFFKRFKLKSFFLKHEQIYKKIRARKNSARNFFLNREQIAGRTPREAVLKNISLLNNFISGVINFNKLFKTGRCGVTEFLICSILKSARASETSEPLGYKRTILRLSPFAQSRVKNFGPSAALPLVKKRINEGFFSFMKRGLLRVKKTKGKFYRIKKINFFFYFFFKGYSIFKFYRLRFKQDSVKYLYRKKKLIFFFEKGLSRLLNTPVVLRFYNPLSFSSLDDVWIRSLCDSLNNVSNMYMKDKRDFKSLYVLSLYTILAFKYNSAAFLGAYLAAMLLWKNKKKKHIMFIKTLVYFLRDFKPLTLYTGTLRSFSIGFYGKVWGKLRAGKFIIRAGERNKAIPLQRASLKMDTSFTWAESQFGTFGIRIWIARD